jgi:VWFA-related protein
MRYRTLAILAALTVSGDAQQNQAPGDDRMVLRSTTQEVLLDFIARDKHRKLVVDLRPQDIEVLEDGVPQTVRSFQYRGGRDESARQDGAPHMRPGAAPAPLREINLVSLVFEGLSPDTRRQATQAAKDFLANEADPNTYIGVFTLNRRLTLLQQYTNNIDLLTQAVDRAATGAYQKFANDMETEVAKLNELAGNPQRFQPTRPGSAEERGPAGLDGGHAPFLQAERRMAAMTVEMLSNQLGNLSIDALQQLIQAQAQLPGRKTVIYFSQGLIVPPEQPERLRAVVSAANRANIAFYTVDPSGLDTMSMVRVANRTTRAINSLDPGGAAVKATNYRENLRDLAEDTGGFAIANTNDARVPLRHVMEEVRAHYEVAYSPISSSYDGHFRAIEIRARRPGIRLQSRNGYFALPILDGTSLAPFEFDALTALNRQPSAHAFDFHAGVLTFHATAETTECQAVFSVPTRALHFAGDAKLFHIHVAFLGLVRDDQNQVVRKVSRDLLFQAPADKRAEFERGEVTITLPLRLPPGRYHLEAVANDAEGGAASTRRIAVAIPSAGTLSDLVLVRRLQPDAEDRDVTNPLEFSGGKVTPEINATVSRSESAVEGVYFVLYPGTGASPVVRIAVTHDGEPVTSAYPSLPPAEADGSIRVLSGIPFGSFDPGVYEVTVTAAQGGATARRMAVIEVQ